MPDLVTDQRLPQVELHRRFINALGARVKAHSELEIKPLEVDLHPPLPSRVRVYLYNATRPPGGRPIGEHKVQLIVPGQQKGERGSFDTSDGRTVLLAGYSVDEDVFILWDAGLYQDFAFSRNVQVKAETVYAATAGNLAEQVRKLRPAQGQLAVEEVVAVNARRLAEGIERRMELTRQRLLRD